MTSRAVSDDAFTRPVRVSLAMGTANPVAFLPEVALAAQLVAVIHVHSRSLFNHEDITLIFFMTGKTVEGLSLPTVHQRNIAMGHFSGLRNFDRFIIVTLATLETLNFILAGPGPESPALVPGLHQDGIHRQRLDRADMRLII